MAPQAAAAGPPADGVSSVPAWRVPAGSPYSSLCPCPTAPRFRAGRARGSPRATHARSGRPRAAARWATSAPGRRGHGVVGDGNLQEGYGNVHRLNHRPWTIPAGPDVPPGVGEDPVLMRVEEDVRRGPWSVVDRRSRDDD